MDIKIGIQSAIKRKGMIQKAVAEKSGFTEQQFSDMMHGRKAILAEYIPRIAYAIGVEVGELFADTGQIGA